MQRTSLHCAVINGRVEVVKELLAAGANARLLDSTGCGVLQMLMSSPVANAEQNQAQLGAMLRARGATS